MTQRPAPLSRLRTLACACTAAAALIGLVGITSLLTRHPWLFASLGSSVLIQAVRPNDDAARPWNTVVGHLTGLATGIAIASLGSHVSADGAHAVWRIAASMAAIATTIVLQLVLRAYHPPGGGTCLLVAFAPSSLDGPSVAGMLLAALLVGIFGLALRKVTAATSTS